MNILASLILSYFVYTTFSGAFAKELSNESSRESCTVKFINNSDKVFKLQQSGLQLYQSQSAEEKINCNILNSLKKEKLLAGMQLQSLMPTSATIIVTNQPKLLGYSCGSCSSGIPSKKGKLHCISTWCPICWTCSD